MNKRAILGFGWIASALSMTAMWSGCTPVVREVAGTGGQGGTGGGATACKPGEMVACYSGPSGTADVGICKSGTALCGDDGKPGACEGEVLPKTTPDCSAHEDQDCDGNIERCSLDPYWVKAYAVMGNTGYALPSLAIDAQGGIAFAGYFNGQLDFGKTTLATASSGADSFIAKINPDGTTAWAKKFGDATENQLAKDIRFDAQGNMIVVGGYYGTLEGLGIVVPPSAGQEDAFVVKLDTNGTPIWARSGGDSGRQSADTLAITPEGDPIVAGTFTGAFAFNGGGTVISIPDSAGQSVFVQRFDKDGNAKWNTSFADGSGPGSGYQYVYAVKVDLNGDVLVTGYFDGSINFPNYGTYPSAGETDVFVVKLQGTTGQVLWARTYGTQARDYGFGLATDSKGNIYMSGRFEGSLQVENTTLVPQFSNTDGLFLLKLTSTGALVWAKSYGCGSGACGMFVEVGENDSLLLTGGIDGDTDFGGSVLQPGFLQGESLSAGFIAKLDSKGDHLASRVFPPIPADAGTQVNPLVINYRIAAVPGTHEIVSSGLLFGQSDFGGGPIGDAMTGGPFLGKFAP